MGSRPPPASAPSTLKRYGMTQSFSTGESRTSLLAGLLDKRAGWPGSSVPPPRTLPDNSRASATPSYVAAFAHVATWLSTARAPLSMVLVQVFTTGTMVLSKVVLGQGMFVYALLTYRNAIAALAVAPLAFCREREMAKKLSWKALLLIFLNATFGVTMATGMYYYGLRDTTASYSTEFLNIIPAVTFILSAVAGVEPLGIKKLAGRAKVTGALCCVGGAMLISLYKGPRIHLWLSLVKSNSGIAKVGGSGDWMRGTTMLVGSCVSYAVWFILQAKLFKIYPAKYWATMLMCVIGCGQSGLLGVLIDNDVSSWRLEWDLQLVTIIYSGLLNTAATFVLTAWAISQRGPNYPPMFNPLSLIFTTVVESLFMGQDLTVGSLLGMFFIIGGLYAFLWGKKKDMLAVDGLSLPVAAVNSNPPSEEGTTDSAATRWVGSAEEDAVR